MLFFKCNFALINYCFNGNFQNLIIFSSNEEGTNIFLHTFTSYKAKHTNTTIQIQECLQKNTLDIF